MSSYISLFDMDVVDHPFYKATGLPVYELNRLLIHGVACHQVVTTAGDVLELFVLDFAKFIEVEVVLRVACY